MDGPSARTAPTAAQITVSADSRHKPCLAGVLRDRPRHLGRLRPVLELLDLVAAAEGVAVDRVLETLHELLQVVDAALQRSDPIRSVAANVLTLGLRLVFHPCPGGAARALGSTGRGGRRQSADRGSIRSSGLIVAARTFDSRPLKAAARRAEGTCQVPAGPATLAQRLSSSASPMMMPSGPRRKQSR